MTEERKRNGGGAVYRIPFVENDPVFTREQLRADYQLMEEIDRECASIRGQEFAIQAVKEYVGGLTRRANQKSVLGLMTFAGLPATGKTSLAEGLARALGIEVLRLDMSSFGDKEAMGDLAGFNPVFHSASAGRLTSWAQKNPHGIVILDELEKAHEKAKRLLLQLFSQGELYDLYLKKNVSFRDILFIATTNVGQELCLRRADCYNFAAIPQSAIADAMKHEINPETLQPWFSSALVSRLTGGRIVMFNRLRPEILHLIAVDELTRLREQYREQYGLRVEGDLKRIATALLLHQGEFADPRTVLKACRELFAQGLVRLSQHAQEVRKNRFFRSISFDFSYDGATEEAAELLCRREEKRVLVFATDAVTRDLLRRNDPYLRYIAADENMIGKNLAELDFAAALVCVDSGEQSKRVFNAISRYEEIPIYVFSQRESGRTVFHYYNDHGAADCFSPALERGEFGDWVASVENGIDLSTAVQRLYTTNKILDFDMNWLCSPDSSVAEVRFCNLRVSTVILSADAMEFVQDRDIPKVTFDDVVGQDAAKEVLIQAANMMGRSRYYVRNGMKIPSGILLTGSPGGGKTMLAKAVANYCNMPFMQFNAGQFLQKYVGEGARTIREMFARARRYAPCILFVDEVDTFAMNRMRGGDNSEFTGQLVNAFLSEMDGFLSHNTAPVLVIAATNFSPKRGETLLDEAFLRRFDHKVEITLPDCPHRLELLRRTVSAIAAARVSESTLESLAARSVGWSPADLSNVVRNGMRSYDARYHEVGLDDAVLTEAFDSYFDGEARPRNRESVRQTAYHEAGHALVGKLLGKSPTYVTVTSRGNYGGYVLSGDEKKEIFTKGELENQICMMLAGRACEVLIYGEQGVNSGAGGDLKQASRLASQMVCELGMDGSALLVLSQQARGEESKQRMEAILQAQYQRATELLDANRPLLERVVKALMEKNSLSATEFEELTEEKG